MSHSTENQHVGTDPINAITRYHAVRGLGKMASLYQRARWVAWLDKFVKNAGAKPKGTTM